MCGFAGLLHTSGGSVDAIRDQAVRMADRLRHRGPDDEGSWSDPTGRAALAFRRLSILDLSPLGHQPMVSPSGRFAMVFNGEVYNFQDLRRDLLKEGVTFRGGSDSEVFLAGFDRWGVQATLPRMIGMFAIALWDTQRHELTLIRDRLGIKPLYVARTARGVAFGSELGAIMVAPGFDAVLDPQAVQAYLRYLFVPAPGTPFRSVRKLPPGHVLRLSPGSLGGALPDPEPFWSVAGARAQGISAEQAARPSSAAFAEEKSRELEALLSDAVRLRMIADVPVGALLSGGIDSSLVVALMRQHSPHPVRTFTIGFDDPEHDESSHARAVAQHLGTEHTELMLTGRDALDVIPSLPEIFDEPLADPSQIPTYLVSRLARQDVTVALCGDGGDELFAGYNRYVSGRSLLARLARVPSFPRRWLGSAVRAVPTGTWERAFALLGRGDVRLVGQKANKLGRLLGASSEGAMYRALLSTWDDPERFLPGLSSGWDPIRDALPAVGHGMSLQDMLFVDQRFYLPDDLLQKVDRASMAVSLEVRVPILDHRVVELSWTLPDDLRIRNGVGKWLLREIVYRHVPRSLLDRPKTGFSVPVAEWLRGPLREWAHGYLGEESKMSGQLFERAEVQRAWKRLLEGRSENALGIWAILMFEAWRTRWSLDAALEAA